MLAEGLNETRELIESVMRSGLAEPGKSDVLFELKVKEQQFQKALATAFNLYFDATAAPDKEPTGAAAVFGGPPTTFTVVVPGQSFAVQAHLVNGGKQPLGIEGIQIQSSDGKSWSIRPDGSPVASLAAGKDASLKFKLQAPPDATITKPYFSRPDEEQPYYNLDDERYRNLSYAPYPLYATAHFKYRDTVFTVRKYVVAVQHVERIGLEANPLIVEPAISIWLSERAGAVPLGSKSFSFSCTLHSNVKGEAKGVLRLSMPDGWHSIPPESPFTMHGGDTQTVTFQVSPENIQAGAYELRAIAEYAGRKFEEGYTLVGYPGVRPYPFFRPATYKAVGVSVTTAPGLRIAFVPGTGDSVPRALEDLGLPVRVIAAGDVEGADLSDYDAIVLGVRAYAVRPELRGVKWAASGVRQEWRCIDRAVQPTELRWRLWSISVQPGIESGEGGG